MSNIDLSQIITAEDRAKEKVKIARDVARGECRRRILEVCDEAAQINLAATAAAGMLPDSDRVIYHAGLRWVQEMRETWLPIVNDGRDPSDDVNWPSAPSGVANLAARY